MVTARTWVPRGLAVAVFCLYALAAPPSFYWLDSAELAAAAAQLGSPHPTGFPLFCIAARGLVFLPVGELAFRIQLLSAACAALAVLWVARLVCSNCKGDAGAIVAGATAGLTLAVSLVFVRQATVVEVYAPTAALVAGVLVLIDRVARGGENTSGLVLAIVCGLGLAMHVTFAFVGLPIAALLVVRLRRGARWPLLTGLLCIGTLAALLAYLPMRSATGRIDAVDWGHPRRIAALADHVTAGRIRRAYSDEMRSTSPAVVAHNAAVFAQVVGDGPGPLPLLAALAGIFALFRRRGGRWLGATILLLAVQDAVYAIWINPMGLNDLQNGIVFVLAVCVAQGAGVAWFAHSLRRVGPYAAGAAGLMLALPAALVSLPAVWAAQGSELPRAFSQAALDRTPARGIALVQNDSTAAGMIYLTAAESARPDVAVLVRQHLVLDVERTRAILARSGDPAASAGFDASQPYESLLATGRAITWEIGRDNLPAGHRLSAGAPLSRLNSTGDSGGGNSIADIRAAARRLALLFADEDDDAGRRVYAHALTALGRLAYGRGSLHLADTLFALAIEARNNHVSAWVNRGVVASRRRDWEKAREYTERGLASDPNRVGALINAARFHMRSGDDGAARVRIDRALSLDSQRADAWALAGLLDLRAGRVERSLERIKRALEIDPYNRDAGDILRQLDRRRKK